MKKRLDGKGMKRVGAIALAFMMALMTGCGGSGGSSGAEQASAGSSEAGEAQAEAAGGEKTVTMAIISGGDTFNPLAADTNGDDYMQLLIWDRPFITKLDGTIEPHLCDSYEMVDGKTMRMHINQEAMWTDGEPVTSEDFVWTAQAMTNKDIAAPRSFIMKYLDGTDESGIETGDQSVKVTAVDDKTVDFFFKEEIDPEMFIQMFNLNFLTLPSHCFEGVAFADVNASEFWDNPIGNGPCIYKSMVQDERIEFTANKDYYMGTPDFDNFVIRIVPAENLLAGLMAGEIDLVAGGSNNLPTADWELAQAQENLVCESAVGPGYYNLCINQQRDYLTPEVCQAIEMAIDKQAISDAIFAGQAEVANSWLPKASKYYNPAVESMNQYDPEAAKALLESSGWDFNRELHLLGNSNPQRIPIIEMIQQNLEDIGMKVNLETADTATCVSKLSGGEVDVGIMGTAGTLDPDNVAINFTVGGPFCFANISDQTGNDAVNAGAAAPTFEERKAIYDDLQVRIKEEVPYIYLYFSPEFVAYNKKLSNVDVTDFFQLQYSVWEWKVAE